MIVSVLRGQLGNQMSEYAAGYAASRDNQEVLKMYRLDYYTLNRWQGYQLGGLKLDYGSEVFRGIPWFCYRNSLRAIFRKITEILTRKKITIPYLVPPEVDRIVEAPSFVPIVLDKNKRVHLLEGYRQSPKYFDKYRDDLLRQFVPSYSIDDESKGWLDIIAKTPIPVSLHVRRGDYVNLGICLSLDYYKRAIDYFLSRFPACTFFVFSDDIEWVRHNLPLSGHNHFVKHSTQPHPFTDMWLMSHCRHNIIANSTYSWWGAYLNQFHDKIVVAPKEGWMDLPPEWELV